MRNPFKKKEKPPTTRSTSIAEIYNETMRALREAEAQREKRRVAMQVMDSLRVVQINSGEYRPVIPGQRYMLYIGGGAYKAEAVWDEPSQIVVFILDRPAMTLGAGETNFDDIVPVERLGEE